VVFKTPRYIIILQNDGKMMTKIRPVLVKSIPIIVSLAILVGLVFFVKLGSTTSEMGQTNYPKEFTKLSHPANSGLPPEVSPNKNNSELSWEKIAEKVGPSVVSISVASVRTAGVGSGMILDTRGRVLTNNHVVENFTKTGEIKIVLNDSSVYDAKIIKTDPTLDLAVLQMDSPPKNLVPVSFADSSFLKSGDPVIAFGSPLGLAGTVTTGIISAVNRPVTTKKTADNKNTSHIINALQTNAAINPGNSGGPLVDAAGNVVGVNTAIATDGVSQGNLGIGFAVPSETVNRALPFLLEGREFPHGRLGISVSAGVAELDNGKFLGSEVEEIVPDSAANQAGLKTGDVIVSVGNVRVSSQDGLVAVVNSYSAGSKLDLKIVRDGSELTIGAILRNVE